MKRWFGYITLFGCLFVLSAFTSHAQEQKPSRHIVSIYNIATGKHLQFLKWIAQQEAIAKEAGAPPVQWFVHQDGAGWDYIGISQVGDPVKEAEQGEKIDAISKKKGVAIGRARWLEFRQFVSTHSDTYSIGPFTAEELVKEAETR